MASAADASCSAASGGCGGGSGSEAVAASEATSIGVELSGVVDLSRADGSESMSDGGGGVPVMGDETASCSGWEAAEVVAAAAGGASSAGSCLAFSKATRPWPQPRRGLGLGASGLRLFWELERDVASPSSSSSSLEDMRPSSIESTAAGGERAAAGGALGAGCAAGAAGDVVGGAGAAGDGDALEVCVVVDGIAGTLGGEGSRAVGAGVGVEIACATGELEAFGVEGACCLEAEEAGEEEAAAEVAAADGGVDAPRLPRSAGGVVAAKSESSDGPERERTVSPLCEGVHDATESDDRWDGASERPSQCRGGL